MVSFQTKPMKLIINVLIISLLLLGVACGTKKINTGWQIIDVGQPINKLPKKIREELLKDFVLVDGGTFVSSKIIGQDNFLTEQKLKYSFALISSMMRVTVFDSYIQKTEVSVGDYMRFCYETNKVDNTPDTLCFRKDFANAQNEPFEQVYFHHLKYKNYPVCGISLEQAKRYCQWKTEKYNTMLNEQGHSVRIVLRLPTAFELENAMQNPCHTMENFDVKNDIIERVKTSNTKGVTDENNIALISPSADGYYYTAPVASFPSSKGLFNLFGNVAEWTQTPLNKMKIELTKDFGILYDEFGADILYNWVMDTSEVKQLRQTCINYETRVPSKYLPQIKEYISAKKLLEIVTDSTVYVVKGGSYAHSPFYTQAGAFIPVPSNQSYSWLGFRMVMEIKPNTPQY